MSQEFEFQTDTQIIWRTEHIMHFKDDPVYLLEHTVESHINMGKIRLGAAGRKAEAMPSLMLPAQAAFVRRAIAEARTSAERADAVWDVGKILGIISMKPGSMDIIDALRADIDSFEQSIFKEEKQ